MYIVCWVSKETKCGVDPQYTDGYKRFETRREAAELYDRLIREDATYTASLCEELESTD